jgi:hypothetical protein
MTKSNVDHISEKVHNSLKKTYVSAHCEDESHFSVEPI